MHRARHDAGQSGAEDGAVVVAAPVQQFEVAGMAADDLAGERESDSVPAMLVGSGGDALLEHPVADVLGDSVAAVDDRDEEVVAVSDE